MDGRPTDFPGLCVAEAGVAKEMNTNYKAMKKLFVLLCLILSGQLLTAQEKMVRLTRFEGTDITGVIASSAFKVELYQGEETRAEVEIPAELENKLEFNLAADGSVNLGLKGLSLKKNQQLSAKIYLKTLKAIRGSGASQITLATPVEADALVIELSGSSLLQGEAITVRNQTVVDCSGSSKWNGSIETRLLRATLGGASKAVLTLQANETVWELSGASDATLSGSVPTANLTAKSASSIDAKACTIESATVTASSASGIMLGQPTELSATASSASKIRYTGTPKIVKLDTSSAATIQKY